FDRGARGQEGGPRRGGPAILGQARRAACRRLNKHEETEMKLSQAFRWLRGAAAVPAVLLGLSMAALPATGGAQTMTKLKAGMVTGIDQVGLPIALERGYFEKHGLDVTIARPYATGVDALNALQAGESDIVQVGVPMIGAVLRGMDLVALGNYRSEEHTSELQSR